jgi:fatty-acid desaturase
LAWLLLLQANVHGPLLDRANVADLTAQPFYRWLEKNWFCLLTLRQLVTWWFGGWEMLAWSVSVPWVLGWHTVFLGASASHIWGLSLLVSCSSTPPLAHTHPYW